MKKTLTFDCYGTLINTAPMYEAVGKLGAESGLDEELVRGLFVNYEDRLMYGESFIPYDELVYQALGYCDLELNTQMIQKGYDEIIQAHREMKPFPEVLETLHRLKEKGYELCLMSNCVPSIMEYNLAALDNVFDRVLLASDTKCYKPDLRFFRMAQEQFGLKREEHCHIAAGYWWDIVPGKKMGWNRIWVNRRNQRGAEEHMPYGEVTALDQAISLLEKEER